MTIARMNPAVLGVLFVAWLWMGGVARPAAAQNNDAGRTDYVEGLQAMASGNFPDAAAALKRAIDANDENADYHVARAVALMMQEDGRGSKPHLDRAGRLDARHEPRTVWQYAWTIMFDQYNMNRQPPYGSKLPYARDAIEIVVPYSSLIANQRPAAERLAALKKIQDVAARYAWHELSKPVNLQALRGAVNKLYADRKYAECLAMTNRLLAGNPTDNGLRSIAAGCRLALGDLAGARDIYTEVLRVSPTDAAMLLGRAIAAARMGSLPTASTDWTLAQQINAKLAAGYKAEIERHLANASANAPKATPAQLMTQLKAAAASESPDQLLSRGRSLVLADLSTRLYVGEVYTQHLARLQFAADSDANNVDKQVALAAYCIEPTADVPNRLAPGKTGRARVGAADLPRAERALNNALRINPKHTGALTQQGLLLVALKKPNDMIKAVEYAISLGAMNLDLAKMYMDYYQTLAAQLEAEAANLRSPKSHTEDRSDGRYLVTVYPSKADLARAAELDRQAAEYRRQSVGPLNQVRNKEKGAVTGHLADAEYHRLLGKYNDALASAQAALNLDAWNLEAHEFFVDLCPKIGQMPVAVEHQDILDNIFAASADRTLAPTWDLLDQTKYSSAGQAIDAAEAKDPASERVAAYRAIVLVSAARKAEAEAPFRVAEAMMSARLANQGSPLTGGAASMLGAESAGRYVATMLVWARSLQGGDLPGSVAKFESLLRAAYRVPADEWSRQIVSGSLPTVFDRKKDGRRTGVMMGEMIVEAHMSAARSLMAMERYEDSARQLVAAWKISQNTPWRAPVDTIGIPLYNKMGRERAAAVFPAEWMQHYEFFSRHGSPKTMNEGTETLGTENQPRSVQIEARLREIDADMQILEKSQTLTAMRKREELTREREALVEELQREKNSPSGGTNNSTQTPARPRRRGM